MRSSHVIFAQYWKEGILAESLPGGAWDSHLDVTILSGSRDTAPGTCFDAMQKRSVEIHQSPVGLKRNAMGRTLVGERRDALQDAPQVLLWVDYQASAATADTGEVPTATIPLVSDKELYSVALPSSLDPQIDSNSCRKRSS